MAIFERNCWLERTPLETGLILILIVAVPFVTVMTIIYSILLMQKCPHCSIKCTELCAKKPANSSLISMLLQLNPNISLPKLSAKYEICPDSMLEHFEQKIDHAFIASVIEDSYEDDVTYQRYLCAAAIITFKWVVSSSKCFERRNPSYIVNVNGVFVRAGSNYWIKGGSVHEAKQVVFADKTDISATVAAIELKIGFPRLSSIRPIMLSRKSLYKNFGIAESYEWNSTYSVPLKYRIKNVKLQAEPHIIFKDAQCERKTQHQRHIFCSQAVRPKNVTCMLYSGFPIARARILLGINIRAFCDLKRNVTVYLIYDITKALNWLENITGVYVEHF